MKEDIEKRRMEAAERRMKSLNMSSLDEDESFNPLSPKSPTFKVNSKTVLQVVLTMTMYKFSNYNLIKLNWLKDLFSRW